MSAAKKGKAATGGAAASKKASSSKKSTSGSMTKTGFISELAEKSGATTAQVKLIVDSLPEIAAKQLRSVGQFKIPGMVALKLATTPAKAARKGINPFTKKEMVFKAKPAGKKIKSTVLKPLKEAAL